MQHCGKKTPRCPLSARKFFNWLDILFPDFPRDQIRVTGEITSRIQFTLTCLNLMWEKQRGGRWGGGGVVVWWCWGIPVSCMSSRALCLIALLLTKCWCNYKKEASFLFLLMRVTLVSGWTGLMKSQRAHSAPAPLLSNKLTVCVFSGLWFCALRITLCQPPSTLRYLTSSWKTCDLFRCQRSYTGCIHPECEYSWANDLRVWEAIAVSLSLQLE